MSALRQLALPFRHAPHCAAEDVLAGPSNAQALAWLGRTGSWPGGRLAVWGAAGCGKTHLLHVWARRTGAALLQGPFLRGTGETHRQAAWQVPWQAHSQAPGRPAPGPAAPSRWTTLTTRRRRARFCTS